MTMDVSYFEELQGRVRGLLISVSDLLPPVTVQLAGEMIDANECGVALETISEMLAESRATISREVFTIVTELVGTMNLDASNAERLEPLVTDDHPGAS
jgi:hypothetical protein